MSNVAAAVDIFIAQRSIRLDIVGKLNVRREDFVAELRNRGIAYTERNYDDILDEIDSRSVYFDLAPCAAS